MDRDLLAHFPVLLTVARRGGFASAAAALNMSPSAVSHAVKAVEDRLGQPLFARTTRSVALTEAGARFVASVGPAMAAVEESVERIRTTKGQVAGVLRLNAPRMALPLAITPAIVAMGRLYPELTIEVTADEGLVDIIAAGFDVGVRLGEMIAQDMVAVRLTPPFQAIMVAAPDYLEAHDAPRSIADLAAHNCIGYRLVSSDAAYAWDLQDRGQHVSVSVRGSVRVTDSLMLANWLSGASELLTFLSLSCVKICARADCGGSCQRPASKSRACSCIFRDTRQRHQSCGRSSTRCARLFA